MRTFIRAIRNLYRSPARTVLVVLVLGLAIGIFITMQQTATIVSSTSAVLKEKVQTLIEIRAAGATGMGRGVQPLEEGTAAKIENIPNVAGLEKYLYVRQVDNSKKYTISVLAGISPITSTLRVNSHGEVGTPTIIEGRGFVESDEGKNVAVVGTIFAEENTLGVGSALELEGASLEVIGIFDSGFVFGNNQAFLPLAVAQETALKQGYMPDKNRLSQIYAVVDSVDNVPIVEQALKNALDDVDILTGQKNVLLASEALSKIQKESSYGAYFTALIAALIIAFTAILAARERTKEIGILKAIGASNGEVAKQFIIEISATSLLGSLVGLVVFALFAPFLAASFLGLASTSLSGLPGMGAQSVGNVVSFTLSAKVLLWGVVFALVLAIIGSAYPVWRAIKLKPAEALRYE